MSGRFGGEAAAALIFLVAYILVFLWMTYAYSTKRMKWRSRYTILYFHATIRIASQACGLVFGILGFQNINVFLAYLILGAEGYFTLVLCAFRFLISWHQHNLPTHESWLEPREHDTSSQARWRKFFILLLLGPFSVFLFWRQPMAIAHTFLILANAAIVFGGSYLAGADLSDPESSKFKTRMLVAKITRTSGQSIFLACNTLLLVAILATIYGERRRTGKPTHPTLIVLLITWIPLIIRGIFGVLQSAVWSLSYYNFHNYQATGFTPRFVAIEYLLGVVTEWIACVLLNVTYFTSVGDPSKGEIAELENKKSQSQPNTP